MRIRILFCQETIASGGVEQRRLNLARYLDKDRYEIKIACTFRKGPIPLEFEEEGVEVLALGQMKHPFDWRIHRKLLRIIREFKPHIIHGAVFEGNMMAAISGALARVPVVVVEETSCPIFRSDKAMMLQRLAFTQADVVVGISESVTEFLRDSVKIPQKKIELINNGVALPQVGGNLDRHATRDRLGFGQGDLVLGFVGRLFDDVKRVSVLIQALALNPSTRVKLLIVGDGKDADSLRAQIDIHGLNDRVVMVGYQRQTSPFYQAMDVFAIPSAHEGFGLAAVEAMMHRLPVIASNTGGLKNIIVDDITGFLIPVDSPEAVAEKVKLLGQSQELREKMGGAGYRRAMELFSSEKYCQTVESLYRRLLTEKGIKQVIQ